jgi:hypothetical protein
MTAREINCLTKSPLADTPRAILRDPVCQNRRAVRIHLPGGHTVRNEKIKSLVSVVQDGVTNNYRSAR